MADTPFYIYLSKVCLNPKKEPVCDRLRKCDRQTNIEYMYYTILFA